MPTIDLSFVLRGTTIPLDHGYSLFSALCRVVAELHGDPQIGVHPIQGDRQERGLLILTNHSKLRLRLSSERIAPYIALAGSELDLEGHPLHVGVPRVEALVPAANLASRMVTIRGALTPPLMDAKVHEALASQEIKAEPSFVPSINPPWIGEPKRRVMRIKQKRIVGYALRVLGLTPEESIRLQETGLGGRRRMGCGMFLPMSLGFAR